MKVLMIIKLSSLWVCSLVVSKLALENQVFLVRVVAMCRGELSAAIAWLMCKCL